MRPPVVILDVDGVIFKHLGTVLSEQLGESTLLPDVLCYLNRVEKMGATIILLTARKESHRHQTECQLREAGVFWDHLVMGVAPGKRYLINDVKDHNIPTAFGINVSRNGGLTGVEEPKES